MAVEWDEKRQTFVNGPEKDDKPKDPPPEEWSDHD